MLVLEYHGRKQFVKTTKDKCPKLLKRPLHPNGSNGFRSTLNTLAVLTANRGLKGPIIGPKLQVTSSEMGGTTGTSLQ